jgi:hypothetical protein
MIGKIRPRLSSAHLIAVAALVFAIGGGSALALTGKNTVRSDDIVNGQVKTADLGKKSVKQGKLAANSVKSGKVVDDSLTGTDINEGTLVCAGIPNADCSADDTVEGAGAAPAPSGVTVFNDLATGGSPVSRSVAGFTLNVDANCAGTITSTNLGAWRADIGVTTQQDFGGPPDTDTISGNLDDKQVLLTAYQSDGTGAAQFEFFTNAVAGGCRSAGTVFGSDDA